MKILIINSRGHWLNGWMTFPESQEVVIKTLENAGCTVNAVEVASLEELETVLKNTTKDTLVWGNAYWVNGENGEEIGLVEQIEKYNLSMVGSDFETLNLLLEKDSCQKQLKAGGIPIPNHIIIQNDSISNITEQITSSNLVFPLVVKPTKESRSQGVVKVENLKEIVDSVQLTSKNFPNSNIIIEEFLPTDDITCGYLQFGSEIIILPSYNTVKGMDCSTEVFGEQHYKQSPSHFGQEVVIDMNTIIQLRETLPVIVDLLGISGVTRIDGRLDANGILKIFDINGMPGLNYPVSALIKQCFTHFPRYEKDYLFECLINTIIAENLRKSNLEIPILMQERNLFNLESETVIRTSYHAMVAVGA